MIRIYFKEAKDSYNSVYDVISDYLSCEVRHPATYWADTGEQQCDRNRNRSFDDLLLLAQHYIPDATIKDVVNAVYRYNINNPEEAVMAICCGDIEKTVISNVRHSLRSLQRHEWVHGLFKPLQYRKAQGFCRNSQWDMEELKAMVYV